MNLTERARLYTISFPNYPELSVSKGWLTGVWMIGNFYRNKSRYYGAYPHSYLKRIKSMFPDCKTTLHLFSGSLTKEDVGNEIRFDINNQYDPTIVGDAYKLSKYFEECFDLILADPPYSNEDAKQYGTAMINRNEVVKECVKILKPNGFLVWLDQVYPMYRKSELRLVGTIGLIRSTNHRVRMVFIFQKQLA